MATKGKRLAGAYTGIDRDGVYPMAEAIKLVKSKASAKFDETVEIAMHLGGDPRHSDQMVRGVVSLPHGTGQTGRVALFAKDATAEGATPPWAILAGTQTTREQNQS